MKKNIITEIIKFFLKFGIAAAVIGYLIYSKQAELKKAFGSFNYLWLLPAMFFYGTHMVVCAWRWGRLARMLNVVLTPFEMLSLTMQGYFFSLVIPGGAIGGDVVKMAVISKRSTGGTKVEGAFTVLMDRIVGMIALFVLALALLYPASGLLMKVDIPGVEHNSVIIALIALLCLAGLGASCVIFFHRLWEKIPFVRALIQWGDRCSHGFVSRLTAATDTYSGNWKGLFNLTVLSVFFVHLMTVVPMLFLLKGAGVEYSLFNVVVALTIGNIIGLIPLFPGGLGGRDMAVIAILTAGGINGASADAVQLLYSAIIIFFNMLGGLFFVFDPGRRAELSEEKANE